MPKHPTLKSLAIASSLIIYVLTINNVVNAKEFHLVGQQRETHVVVDLNKDNLKWGEDYIIGKDKSLTITGAGDKANISSTVKTKGLFITIAGGTLYFGDSPHSKKKGKRKKKRKRLKDLDQLPMIKLPVNVVLRDKKGNTSTLVFNNIHLLGKKFLAHRAKNIKFTNALIGNLIFDRNEDMHVDAFNSAFYKCQFFPRSGDPISSRKNIRFNSCVFGNNTRVDLHLLWGMKKCDLLKGTLRYDTIDWPKKIPKLSTSNYYGDKQMQQILANTLKPYRAYKRSRAKKAFWSGLSKLVSEKK